MPSNDRSEYAVGYKKPPHHTRFKKPLRQSKRRRREIPDRWVTAGREMLEVLQDAGVHPKAADDLCDTPARAVARHRDRRRPGIGNDVLNSAGKPSAHHVARGQKRQDRKQNDTAPGQDPKRCHDEGGLHRFNFIVGAERSFYAGKWLGLFGHAGRGDKW